MSDFRIHDERSRAILLDVLSKISLNTAWDVTIKRHRKKRTLSQLRLMWKWVDTVAEKVSEQTGYTAAEVHELFKAMFIVPKRIEIAGRICERRSTTDLTVEQMSRYMDSIYQFALTELGLYLPTPEMMHEDAA
jgi:hypothetical protein